MKFNQDDLLELLTKKNKEVEKLRTYRIVVDYLKDKLMHSNMSIEDVSYIMSILNYAEDKECINTYFYEKRLINQELREALNRI